MKTILRFSVQFALFTVLLLSLSACSGGDNYEYFPFQSEKDGKWGLMGQDGKVLFDEEFKYAPSVATCGRFWAMNEKGYYELYTTDRTPKRIGEEYRYVSLFHKGKAIVTQRDHPASVINTKGEVLVDLNKIGGKMPDRIFNISDGLAVYMTDTVCGVFDYDGKVIVKPTYGWINEAHDGKIVANDTGFSIFDEVSADSLPEAKSYVLDYKGNILLSISNRKYHQIGSRFYSDYLAVGKTVDGEPRWGIIDVKGDEVVKLSKKYAYISEMSDKGFIYMDDQSKYGLMSYTGETLIRPKYDYMTFASPDAVIATTLPQDQTESPEVKSQLVSIDGEVLTEKKYESISSFIPTRMKTAIVCIGDNNYGLIDRKGERIKDVPDMAMAYINDMLGEITSDYVNIPEFLDNVGFTSNGVDSLSFSSSVTQTLERQARYFSMTNKPQASNYTNTNEVYIYRTVDAVPFGEEIIFPQTLAMQTFRQEMVIDYVDYYYNMYWYHMKNVPTGFQFRTIKPSQFVLKFDNYGPLRGKMKPFYTQLAARFKKMGSVVKENDSAVVVDLGNGRKAMVWIDEHEVTAKWGTLSDTNIDQYYGNKENLDIEIESVVEPYD